MENLKIAVTLIDSIQHLVETPFGTAVQAITSSLPITAFLLQAGDTHTDQTYRGGPVLVPPVFEQGPGHAVKCSCVV